MSAQKLVAEADKLFEKGKFPEGIAKLQQAVAAEPLNQIVATKLANVLVQNKDPSAAAKVYGGLAKRLSDAGKSQVAIAIFKQALELDPNDHVLRMRFAQECESVGKSGDAFLQAQIVLSYYLRRKKTFDASNVLPLMCRAQPKDEKVKLAWIDVIHLCQAEQKLLHLLVALAGPPGLVSQEFPVGGDPAALSPAIYDGLKKLLPFFPRDPKLPYALAWSAYRRGQLKDCFRFLQEVYRREPDYGLATLLFARVLAENEKLNEAMFVYRYFKERMAADKGADMLTLNRLMEAFIEKNGWIKFIEDSGDLLDANGFLKAVTGKAVEKAAEGDGPAQVGAAVSGVGPGKDTGSAGTGEVELPPAEVDLSGGGDAGLEVITTAGQSVRDVSSRKSPRHSDEEDPLKTQAEIIRTAVAAAVQGMKEGNTQVTAGQTVVIQGPVTMAPPAVSASPPVKAAEPVPPTSPAAPAPGPVQLGEADQSTKSIEAFQGESVEFTTLVKRPEMRPPEPESGGPAQAARGDTDGPEAEREDATTVAPLAGPQAPAGDSAPESASEERTTVRPLEAEGPAEELPPGDGSPARPTFNPFADTAEPDQAEPAERPEPEAEERTQMFEPIDEIDAARSAMDRKLGDVETRVMEIPPSILAPAPAEEADPGAQVLLEPDPEPTPAAEKTKWKQLRVEGEKTITFSPSDAVNATQDSRRPLDPAIVKVAVPPVPSPPDVPAPAATAEAPPAASEATRVAPHPGETRAELEHRLAQEGEPTQMLSMPPPVPPPAEAKPGGLMPLPEPVQGKLPVLPEEPVDLGDDLLEGPTKIFTQPPAAEKTEQLLREIRRDLKKRTNQQLSLELLLKKAEQYSARRNYYLARKALRHARALGADEEMIKERLREVRKLELPEGLYHRSSSDTGRKESDTREILSRLEREFELVGSDELLAEDLGEAEIRQVIEGGDARTALDLGVGLHEMGLYRQAESLFLRLVDEFPEHAFDAYYLASVSKIARHDLAGAASILRHLSGDHTRAEREKIQVYYALGEIFEKMEQPDRSRQCFQKVAEIDSNYRNVRTKLER